MHLSFILSYFLLKVIYGNQIGIKSPFDNRKAILPSDEDTNGYDPDSIYWGDKQGKDFDQKKMSHKIEDLE